MTIPVQDHLTTDIEIQRSLTARAMLGGLSNALQFVIRLIVGLVITPFIIRGLGQELYGIWTMIQQTLGYVGLADLRVTNVVKFTLAVEQHKEDYHFKRQQVGASVLALAQVAPLILSAGVIIVCFAPEIVGSSAVYDNQVRWAVGIGIVGILMDSIFSVPGNILRGVNLEYKAIGLTAFVSALSSSLSAIAVWLNTGLVGLAVSIEVGTFITGSVRYLIARANVPWLGIAWPPRKMLSDFWRQALWLFLASLGYVMQNSSDLLIVGILLNPSAAAIYGTTGAVLRMAIEPLYAIISSANAGIAGLCGQQAWDRVERVRNEIHLMALVVITVLGVGVLSLNRAFMAWWIGPSYYAGDTLNVLLVLLALQSIPLRSDVMLMDGMLKFRERAISTIVANALGMGFAGVLAHFSGLEGAALGLFLGRVLAMTTYQIIIKQGSGIGVTGYFRWMGRPLLVGAGLLTVGYFSPFHLTNLISFFAVGAIVTLISSLIMWFLGLNAVQRSYLSQRFGSQLPKVTRYITSRG